MRDECEATGGDPALRALGRCVAVLLPEPDGQAILLHDTDADPALHDALGRLTLTGALCSVPPLAEGLHLDARGLLPGLDARPCAARLAKGGGILVLAGWTPGTAPVSLRAALDALDRALRRCAVRPASAPRSGEPRPARAPSPFEAVFENATHCMAVIGQGRRLLSVNRAGRRVLAEARLLREVGGRLRAAEPGEDRRLADALDERAGRDTPCSVVLGGAGGAAGLRCEVGRIDPHRRPDVRDEPRFLLTAVPIAAEAPMEALLGEAYGLTRAEARLAAEIVAGRDLRSASERMGVSHHTARKYLQIAFSKMGVRRQADLVRLALRLAHDPTASAA